MSQEHTCTHNRKNDDDENKSILRFGTTAAATKNTKEYKKDTEIKKIVYKNIIIKTTQKKLILDEMN